MIYFASIVDREANTYSEHSSTLELPKDMVRALEKDVQVYTVVNESIEKIGSRQLARSYSFIMTKRRFIYESCENVLLRYLLNDILY